MRLDASTAEIVDFLRKHRFSVHYPTQAEVTDEEARIALSGGHTAIVHRDYAGRLRVTVDCNRPPTPEPLTNYDLSIVAMAIDAQERILRQKHHDVLGKPDFRQLAGAYADDLNNLVRVRCKVDTLLRNKRIEDFANEAEELASQTANESRP